MGDFRLTPAAERDLEAIWLYTRSAWGRAQADRYIDLLASAFADLASSPSLAPACDHIRAGYRRWAVDRHMIYFRVEGSGIVVVRVLHHRMDAPRHL